MPKEWYDRHAIAQIKDEEKRNFYMSIVADKKPYFMIYIYNDLMKRYRQYVKNAIERSYREWGCDVEELLRKPVDTLTYEQGEFLDYYDRYFPVGNNDCVMNKLCVKVECALDSYLKKHKFNDEYDYALLKSDLEYTSRQFKGIQEIVKECSDLLSQSRQRRDTSMSGSYLDDMGSIVSIRRVFEREALKFCSNNEIVANVLIDVCKKNTAGMKFYWGIYGTEGLKNMVANSDHMITFPVEDESGEITYYGGKYTILKREVTKEDLLNDSFE